RSTPTPPAPHWGRRFPFSIYKKAALRKLLPHDPAPTMKIRDIEIFQVNIGGQNRVLLRVLTDEHLHGTGEAYCVGPDEATVQTIHYFKDWLVGQDPFRIEYLWRRLYNSSRHPRRGGGAGAACRPVTGLLARQGEAP